MKIEEKKLPNGWEVRKLGEVCREKEGLRRGPFGSAIKKEFFVADGYKVYEQSNAIYDDVNRGRYFVDEAKYNELIAFNVKPGDLIVSCSGTLGKIAQIPTNAKQGIINQALLRIRLIDEIISKKYFLYFFRSEQFQRKIIDQSQGTAISNLIGIKDFKEIQITLPPIAEQQAIVAKIEELFSELENGKKELLTAQAKLKTYRQSLLKWAFEGRLTNKNLKDGELPKGWEVRKLGEVCKKISLNGIKIKEKDYLQEGRFPVVDQGQELIGGYFNDEKLVIPNDPPYIIFGDHTKVKKFINFKFIAGADGVKVLKVNSILDPKFFFYLIHTVKIPDKGYARHFQFLEREEILIPPLSEQQQIVAILESKLTICDAIEETIKTSINKCEALRQSILKKAFLGELINKKNL